MTNKPIEYKDVAEKAKEKGIELVELGYGLLEAEVEIKISKENEKKPAETLKKSFEYARREEEERKNKNSFIKAYLEKNADLPALEKDIDKKPNYTEEQKNEKKEKRKKIEEDISAKKKELAVYNKKIEDEEISYDNETKGKVKEKRNKLKEMKGLNTEKRIIEKGIFKVKKVEVNVKVEYTDDAIDAEMKKDLKILETPKDKSKLFDYEKLNENDVYSIPKEVIENLIARMQEGE